VRLVGLRFHNHASFDFLLPLAIEVWSPSAGCSTPPVSRSNLD
jgi:hypothetical protein